MKLQEIIVEGHEKISLTGELTQTPIPSEDVKSISLIIEVFIDKILPCEVIFDSIKPGDKKNIDIDGKGFKEYKFETRNDNGYLFLDSFTQPI